MAYTKLGWVNDQAPALNQTNLNHMDQGIYDAHQELAEYEDIFTGDVDESVQNWLDEHPEATTTVQDGAITTEKLSNEVQQELEFGGSGVTVSCNIIGEYAVGFDTEENQNYGLQGLCYIEDEKYCFYSNPATGDIGKLICIDLSNYSLVWEVKLTLYHGATLCFNPDNRNIYIAPWEYDDGTGNRNVLVVPYDTHNSVETIAIPPTVNGDRLLSISYDNQKYYLYFDVASAVVYETQDFLQFSEISLNNMRIKKGTASIQTVFVHEKEIYCLYSAPGAYVEIFNIDGEKIGFKNFPYLLNGFRKINEIEGITYNNNRNCFVCSSFLPSTGIPQTWLATFFDVGITQDILESVPRLTYSTDGIAPGDTPILYVSNEISIMPRVYSNYFTCIDDAVNYLNNKSISATIAIDAYNEDKIVRNYNINVQGSVKIAKRGINELFLENVTTVMGNVTFETVSFRETNISPNNSAFSAKNGAIVNLIGCKFYMLTRAILASDAATIRIFDTTFEELNDYTGTEYLKSADFGVIMLCEGNYDEVPMLSEEKGNIIIPEKTYSSNISFTDALGEPSTTSGVGGALDTIKSNINTYTNYTTVVINGEAGGPLYGVVLLKVTNSIFSGIAFGYKNNFIYYFKYQNNMYTVVRR